jgi:hypothetical protein
LFIRGSKKKHKIEDELQLKRLQTLHDCLKGIENTRDDEAKCSAAKSACIECDVILKMHQQLPKIKARHDYTLHSLLETVKQENKPILHALITAAENGSVRLKDSDAQSPQLNRLKVSHYQALAEQGNLEPGNHNCGWIRGAFDVAALKPHMEETALAELSAAIE